MNYAIFCELCDRMRFEVDCAKSHRRVISEGLSNEGVMLLSQKEKESIEKYVHEVTCTTVSCQHSCK